MRIHFAAAVAVLFAAVPAGGGALSGTLDASFGAGGKLIFESLRGDAEARAIAVQPGDGRILVAGAADRDTGQGRDGILLRLEPDGQLDGTFGDGGIARVSLGDRCVLNSLTLLDNGSIAAAGAVRMSQPAGDDDLLVAVFDAGGAPDPRFGAGGMVLTRVSTQDDRANAIATDGLGRIIVAGTSKAGRGARAVVARYDAGGNLDAAFNQGGPVVVSFGQAMNDCRAVVTDSRRRIVAGGSTFRRDPGSPVEAAILRLTEPGALDVGFGDGGIQRMVFSSALAWRSLLVLPGDGILAGGDAVIVRESQPLELRLAFARFLENGAADVAFGGGGLTTVPLARAAFGAQALLQDDGRIVATCAAVRSSSDFAAVRLTEEGAVDTTFGLNGAALTNLARSRKRGTSQDVALAGALQPDGKILLAGQTNAGSGRRTRIALVRYHP